MRHGPLGVERGGVADHDGRDIVVAAGGERRLDQPLGRDMGLGSGQNRRDRCVVHQPRQTIAAEQKHVVGLKPAIHDVQLELWIYPDCAGNPTGERVRSRLLGGQLTALDRALPLAVTAEEAVAGEPTEG